MLAFYDRSVTMREARRVYFEKNKFGADGGYGDAWVDFKLGPIPFPFPNTAPRVRAVKFHDLHHVLTGYDTNFTGEVEISAWEIGAGCKGMVAAWMLNLGGIATGMYFAPRRVFRAFVRGRHSSTLYADDLEAALDKTVGEQRATHVTEPGAHGATASDIALFLLAWFAGFVVGAILFWLFVPLAPFGLLTSWLRKRAAARRESVERMSNSRSDGSTSVAKL